MTCGPVDVRAMPKEESLELQVVEELTPEEREPEVSMTYVLHITEPKKELRDAGQRVRGATLPSRRNRWFSK